MGREDPEQPSGEPEHPQLASERRIRDALDTLVRELEPLGVGVTGRVTHAVAGLPPRTGTRAARLEIARRPHYRLGEQLGVGGMAEVFRGWQIGAAGFERPVAIKRMLPKIGQSDRFVAMFTREAQVLAQLSHPNIVSVLDLAYDDDGQLLLVLEYVDGIDLDELIASGPVPPTVILYLAAELLNGLGYAHHLPANGSRTLGVVHRDLSPSNILLSWEGAVKITDFGLAKTRRETHASVSRNVLGKIGYMSPEHMYREPLDGRSDLFSLGAILWEMLVCEPLSAHERPIARPSVFRPVPRDLERVVMKLLRYDRNRRYRTAEAVLDALATCEGAPSFRGRVELVELLAQRFPAAAQRSTSRPPLQPPTPIAPLPPGMKPAPLWERWRWSMRQRRWSRQRRRARRLPRCRWCVVVIAVCVAAMVVLPLLLRVLSAKAHVSW